MKYIFTLLMTLTFTFPIYSQTVAGDWSGVLDVQGTQLELIFHISEADGKYSTTMDSPAQGGFDIPMDETTYKNGALVISGKNLGLTYEAKYDASSDMISGTFNQGPMSIPLELKRHEGGNDKKDKKTEIMSDHQMAGNWNGILSVMGSKMRLVFNIDEKDGNFTTALDSPDQGSFGMATKATTVDGNDINIDISSIGASFSGTLVPDSSLIRGTFKQGGQQFPMVLTKEKLEKPTINRPQEPKSFDYKQEDVKFENANGGHTLAGTLTIPKDGKFDKAVVLVSGSGPQNRNEELLGHKPFLVLSDYLTRNGVAVLRYDDRGVAESTGDFKSATSMDFAEDAKSAIQYLKTRPDMKNAQLGIMGHSEGGLIAPIVADMIDLDFIVLLAGPGIKSSDLLIEQSKAISLASGVEKERVEKNIKVSRKIFDYISNNTDMEIKVLRANLTEKVLAHMQALPKKEQEEIGNLEENAKQQVDQVTEPWFRYFISYDPAPYLEKVTIPTLAVNGSLDLQVLPKSNLAGIEKGLKKAGNQNFTIKEFDKLNHLFQVSETGAPSEYGELEETFNEEAMKYVLDWVQNYDKK